MKALYNDTPGRKLWCGPVAIAIAADIPMSVAWWVTDAAVRRRGGRTRHARGMRWGELVDALKSVGARVSKPMTWPEGITLRRFIGRVSAHARRDTRWVVCTNYHYLVVEGLLVADSRWRVPTWWADTRPGYKIVWAVEVSR